MQLQHIALSSHAKLSGQESMKAVKKTMGIGDYQHRKKRSNSCGCVVRRTLALQHMSRSHHYTTQETLLDALESLFPEPFFTASSMICTLRPAQPLLGGVALAS